MLLFELQSGAVEEHVIAMAIREGHPIPKGIAEAPALGPGLSLYLSAFSDLRTCAPENGPIPWTATQAYADAKGFDAWQTAALHHHTRALDRALLEHMAKERKAHDAKAVRRRDASARKKY